MRFSGVALALVLTLVGWVPLEGGDAERPVRSLELPGGAELELVWIPPGKFVMGTPESEAGRVDDEGVQHRVTLSQGFWLGRYEVTQAQWLAVMGDNPSRFRACGGSCPVERVSWESIQEFLARAGEGLRLPTEAEWEYACRAGTRTAQPTGSLTLKGEAPGTGAGADRLVRRGNAYVTYEGGDPCEVDPDRRCGPHPVGLKEPNPWGLYDMLGNVREWTADWLSPLGPEPVTDPRGKPTGTFRTLRGGGWQGSALTCRCGFRYAYRPEVRSGYLGFRVAVSAPPPTGRD